MIAYTSQNQKLEKVQAKKYAWATLVPQRPKYFRKTRWEKLLRERGLWLTNEALNKVIDNAELMITPLYKKR